MDLKQIISEQHEFSASHFGTWELEDSEKVLERIKFGTIALTGEVGEFANILKKILRDRKLLDEKLPHLKEELADVFAYVMLLSVALKMDLEVEWRRKLNINQQRFEDFGAVSSR